MSYWGLVEKLSTVGGTGKTFSLKTEGEVMRTSTVLALSLPGATVMACLLTAGIVAPIAQANSNDTTFGHYPCDTITLPLAWEDEAPDLAYATLRHLWPRADGTFTLTYCAA
jgi:hypothetical protein